MNKYVAKVFKSKAPHNERSKVFEAHCFEEAVSKAYVWRVGLSDTGGNTREWKFQEVARLAEGGED